MTATALDSLIGRVNQYIINPALGFLFVLACLYFLWGIIQFYLYQDSEDERETGKRHIIYGLIGLLIITGFFGIMQIIASTFNVPLTRP